MTKKEKKEVERKVIEVFWNEPINRETIVKIYNRFIKAGKKGLSILIVFSLFIIIALIIALVNYLF